MNIVLALILIQPPPPGTTGELQFPRMSTPYSCSAGREGRVYYDMDTELPMWCDDTTWQPFGTTISGTNPYLARFNSAGNNVETSDLRNTGVPAAGAGGSIVDLSVALNAMDGTDTINGITVQLTGASHSGAGNVIQGITPQLISPSSNASERAYGLGANWDYGIDWTWFRVLGAQVGAAASGNIVEINSTLAAMDGSDTVTNLLIQMNNASSNHTGTSNFIYGARFIMANSEADATEAAINIADTGNEWDQGIRFDHGMDSPYLYAAKQNATNPVILFDSAFETSTVVFNGNAATRVAFEGGKEITHLMGTDLSLAGTTLTIAPDANVVEVFGDGSDTVSIITGPSATSNTQRVTFICQDADVTFIDSDAAGAAGTVNLAGTATDFVCSADDTLTLAYYVAPVSGNARWVEVSRSVN